MSLQDLGRFSLGEGKLRILQLTDLHLFPHTCTEWENNGKSVRLGDSVKATLDLAHRIARRVQPHLCVLTGDIIDGRPFQDQSWRTTFENLTRPLVEMGCKFSFCPGNHDDDQSPWSREDLLGVFDLPGCISHGATSFDHTLSVSTTGGATRMFLFDSGGNDAKDAYGTVRPESVDKCRNFIASVNENALCFFHIPFPETGGLDPIVGSQGLFEAALASGKVPRPWCWVPWFVRFLGLHRVVGCSKRNAHLFDVLASSQTRACFFGHDHHSDAVFSRSGLYLAYGRCGSCTPPSNWEGQAQMPFEPGARVIEVDGQRVETWVETALGEVSGSRLVLDATLTQGRSRGHVTAALLVVAVALVCGGYLRLATQ